MERPAFLPAFPVLPFWPFGAAAPGGGTLNFLRYLLGARWIFDASLTEDDIP